MNKRLLAVAAIGILLIVGVLAASNASFSAAPTSEVTYTPPSSAVHASSSTTTSDGTIALRLNGISDTSDPATSRAWIEFNNEAHAASGVYNFSLVPPPASRYLVANVTVTNVHHTQIPFDYGDFVLIARDGTAYYANYAVCNAGCSAQALAGRALNETFANDVYVLFSVPTTTQPTEIAYTGANPPIVMSST